MDWADNRAEAIVRQFSELFSVGSQDRLVGLRNAIAGELRSVAASCSNEAVTVIELSLSSLKQITPS